MTNIEEKGAVSYMKKNEKVLKILKPLQHCNHEKMNIIIGALIDYYSGVPRKEILLNHPIASTTFSRILFEFKSLDKRIYIYLHRIWRCLHNNPFQYNMPFSLWTSELLKLYIEQKYHINVTENFCKRVIQTYYSAYYNKSKIDILKLLDAKSDLVTAIQNKSLDEFCICTAWFGFLGYNKMEVSRFQKKSPFPIRKIKIKSTFNNPINVGVLLQANRECYYDAFCSDSKKSYIDQVKTLQEFVEDHYLKDVAYESNSLFIILEKNLENVRVANLLIKNLSYQKYNYKIYFVPAEFDYNILNSFGKVVLPQLEQMTKQKFQFICRNIVVSSKESEQYLFSVKRQFNLRLRKELS